MAGSWLRDRRARFAALRVFRTKSRVVGRTKSGRPILDVGAEQLSYRGSAGDRYWRRMIPCASCGHRTAQGSKIRTRSDLERAAPTGALCHACREEGAARTNDPTLLRAKMAQVRANRDS